MTCVPSKHRTHPVPLRHLLRSLLLRPLLKEAQHDLLLQQLLLRIRRERTKRPALLVVALQPAHRLLPDLGLLRVALLDERLQELVDAADGAFEGADDPGVVRGRGFADEEEPAVRRDDFVEHDGELAGREVGEGAGHCGGGEMSVSECDL